MKKIYTLILLLFLTSCSSFEIHFRSGSIKGNPKKILIGNFEKRTFEFNPFVIKNFRDSLRFEFFKRGYKAELLTQLSNTSDKIPYIMDENLIKEYNRKYSSDIFIQGNIFEANYGDAIESNTSTSITLMIYDTNGVQIGEAQCIASDTLKDAGNIRDISSSIVNRMHEEFNK